LTNNRLGSKFYFYKLSIDWSGLFSPIISSHDRLKLWVIVILIFGFVTSSHNSPSMYENFKIVLDCAIHW